MCKKCSCGKEDNSEDERNKIRHDLNFRIGGVGLKKGSIDYAKVVEAHYDFLKILAGIPKKDKNEKENVEDVSKKEEN